MQEETTSVAVASVAVDLNIHKRKSKILRCNTTCTIRITLDGEDLEDVKTSTYLGSIIDEHSGSDEDVNAWIGKTKEAYLQLKNIWNSKQMSTNTKQQRTMGEKQPDPNGARNQEEALEVDKKYIEESTHLHHKTSLHLKPSRSKEKKMKTKEHTTSGNVERHEKNEEQLDRTRKEFPEQSGLENAGRQSMLYWG
ncbi:unnamed protein product [Schistosoma mattheei]|uniref:Uncharacterized protein n=1 Tax=Schistosoma mattheei TaxID=31246 RepID=A0A183NSA2_9TREM|nr:unnamed protein product [Schistosoma mattheei]